jgi:hypothetical protein
MRYVTPGAATYSVTGRWDLSCCSASLAGVEPVGAYDAALLEEPPVETVETWPGPSLSEPPKLRAQPTAETAGAGRIPAALSATCKTVGLAAE